MLVESGIDPVQVLALRDRIMGYKKELHNILQEVTTTDRAGVNRNYEGQAATALMDRIARSMPQLDAQLDEVIRVLNQNMEDDLNSTQRTDVALAG